MYPYNYRKVKLKGLFLKVNIPNIYKNINYEYLNCKLKKIKSSLKRLYSYEHEKYEELIQSACRRITSLNLT